MERTSTSRGRAGAKKSSRKTSPRRAGGRKASSTRSTSTARKTSTRKTSARKTSARKTSTRKGSRPSRAASKGGTQATRRTGGRRYGPKTQEKVGEVMHEMKEGELRSSTGKRVTNPKQAIAIGLSEARRAGSQAPPRPRRARKTKRAS